MNLQQLVGIRIRAARRELDWSQETLAEKVGIKQSNLAKYEAGKVNIPLQTLERISKVLQRPVTFFVASDYEYTVKAPLSRGGRDEQQSEYTVSKKADSPGARARKVKATVT